MVGLFDTFYPKSICNSLTRLKTLDIKALQGFAL
jgi:hypothetical protein